MAARTQEESFFYGRITGLKTVGTTLVEISTRESSLKVHLKDPGIPYIPIGRRRLVVVRGGRVVAVYIRSRRKLFLRFGSCERVSDDFLKSLRPKYFYKDKEV